jgi:UDPglucose 6-dehydrogenase
MQPPMITVEPTQAVSLAVIGTGYVGLVTGVCLASVGHQVLCLDKDQAKLETLRQAKSPIYEPGLEELMQDAIDAKRITFDSNLERALTSTEVCFIAVGTPQRDDGSADLKYLWSVADEIVEITQRLPKEQLKTHLLIIKSTVPVGTCEAFQNYLNERLGTGAHPFTVASNPEFLKQGLAVQDFMNPDRIVVGLSRPQDEALLQQIYSPWTRHADAPVALVCMTLRSAEMSKYAANAFLATKITFMNEMSNLCELMGADINDVKVSMGLDPRIGPFFLNAGIGYGGSCFPKDVKALRALAHDHHYDAHLLNSVDTINKNQAFWFLNKLVAHFGGEPNLNGKTIAVWGLAFKPNTDDMREAPSIRIIENLRGLGVNVRAFDPQATSNARRVIGDQSVTYCDTPIDAVQNADALLLLTEWSIFKSISIQALKDALVAPIVFDGRNCLDEQGLLNAGFYYQRMGKTIAYRADGTPVEQVLAHMTLPNGATPQGVAHVQEADAAVSTSSVSVG